MKSALKSEIAKKHINVVNVVEKTIVVRGNPPITPVVRRVG